MAINTQEDFLRYHLPKLCKQHTARRVKKEFYRYCEEVYGEVHAMNSENVREFQAWWRKEQGITYEEKWESAVTPVMNSKDYHEIKGLQGQIVQFSLGYNNNLFIVDEDGCKWEFFNANNEIPLVKTGLNLDELQNVTLNKAFYSFGCAVGEGCWTTIDFMTSRGEFSIEYQDRASYTYSEGE